MTKAFLVLLSARVVLTAQVCSLITPANCPTTGTPQAGPPTLQSFVAGAASSLAATTASVAGLPQPRMIFSGEVVPASSSYITFDPMTCPNSGTCYFNNIPTIENYIDSLTKAPPNGVGMTSLDFNIWLGPMFEASEYAAACAAYGACYTPSSSSPNNASWYTRSLATYDAVFAYAAARHVLIRLAPAPSGDIWNTCGITPGAGNFTEAQVENCLKPLYVVLVQRYHIDYDTVIHEPCGLWKLVLGTAPACGLSVSDADTFIRGTAAAIRATSQYPGIKIGAGAITTDAGAFPYSCANSGNYWCDWMGLISTGVLDFGGLDVYPETANPSSGYLTDALAKIATMAAQVPAGKEIWANESSSLRWSPLQSGIGEAGTYWGGGYVEWLTSGIFAAWAASVPGAWAPAHGFRGWSLFGTEPLIYLSSDPDNTHCSSQSLPADTYDLTAMAYAGRISPEGLAYGRVAQGWSASLQGNAHITGRAHLGR
ncbi:MAG TPA: hypothetical protein VKR61_17850 [Bryobacteraceae bacterium]|nr:hypothetical protein [Bryobacteraceae bacterium]